MNSVYLLPIAQAWKSPLKYHNYYPYVILYTSFAFKFQVTGSFWQTWKEFEVRHGNEDTMREMLRIKRSVQATYNTQVFHCTFMNK